MIKYILVLLFVSIQSFGAIYYVSKGGNDSNPGTATNSTFLTLGKLRTLPLVAGDTAYVLPEGLVYEEDFTWTADGTASSRINIVFNWNYINGTWSGTPAIIRTFRPTSSINTSLIGFEMTHVNTSYGVRPINFAGTCTNIWVLDANIHDVYAGDTEQVVLLNGTPTHNVFRGNTITYANPIGALGGSHANYAFGSAYITPFKNVFEYNTITKVNDFFSIFGTYNILRNNVCMDHTDSYWDNSTGHSDGFQLGSDGADAGSKHGIVERNFVGDGQCLAMAEAQKNSHFLLIQDQSPPGTHGDTNFLVRGNIAFYINDGMMGNIGVGGFRCYNQTFYDMNVRGPSSTPVYFTGSTALDCFIMATGFVENDATLAMEFDSGASLTKTNNAGYNGGTDSSFVTTGNPLLGDPASPARNFYIGASSPWRGAGINPATITSTTGSGTSFVINRIQMFTDGYGMVEGDLVVINGTTTRVTGIDWSTSAMTVADSVSWTQNATTVAWDNANLDIGALPYGSTRLTAATISAAGTTYTVSTTGDARGVWFYTNGVPHVWDYTSPYQTTVDGTVTARAYARYAQASPVVTATAAGPGGSPSAYGYSARVGSIRAP